MSPIALLLLFLRLFEGDGKKKQIADRNTEQIEDSHFNRTKTAVGKVPRSSAVKKSNVQGLQIASAAKDFELDDAQQNIGK